jgi:hypothetical protein
MFQTLSVTFPSSNDLLLYILFTSINGLYVSLSFKPSKILDAEISIVQMEKDNPEILNISCMLDSPDCKRCRHDLSP